MSKGATSDVFPYAGQAVIEGVMFRGERTCSVTVRLPENGVRTTSRPVPASLNRLRRVPLFRGVVLLVETMTLGLWALRVSEKLSKGQDLTDTSGAGTAGRVMAVLAGALGLFFLFPFAIASALEARFGMTPGEAGVLEGFLRIATLVAYVVVIGRLRVVRRVFAFHAAEHMVARAHQDGVPLRLEEVRRQSRLLPWCGTTLVLTVLVAGTVVFAVINLFSLGWEWAVASRVLLPPVIAAFTMEAMAFSGRAVGGAPMRVLAFPGLLLQRLTTRPPSDDQIAVAIEALQVVIAQDQRNS